MGSVHASLPNELVAFDITGPFPESDRGCSFVLVVGDVFTKFTMATPLRNQTAKEVASASMSFWIQVFWPREIVKR